MPGWLSDLLKDIRDTLPVFVVMMVLVTAFAPVFIWWVSKCVRWLGVE